MKTTIELAREAGIELDLIDEDEGQIWYITTEGMKAFEALVRADERDRAMRENAYVQAEREACAKVCESLFDMDDDSCSEAEQCAAAIRARGNT
jgi:hypothetical protein